MEKAFEQLFLTIVEDGGAVTVGDKMFNVTLAEAVTSELKPEPTLTVPDNVEFVLWDGDIALKHNGFILAKHFSTGSFLLSTEGNPVLSLLDTPPQLIPCELSEVQNGDWVVNKDAIDHPIAYRLKIEKGWVSFDIRDEYPIEIEKELSDLVDWLKVVQG